MPNLKWNTVSQIWENDWSRKAADPFKIYENLILRISLFSFKIYKIVTIGHLHFTLTYAHTLKIEEFDITKENGTNHFWEERQGMSSNSINSEGR